MIINKVEIEDIDIYDVDVAEKYESAVRKVKSEVDAAKELTVNEETTLSSVIRSQCKSIFNFFNTLGGEGTDKKIFGAKVNLMTCLDAFEELIENVEERRQELDKKLSKYSPNRIQKRANKK